MPSSMCEDVARDASLTSRNRGRHSTPLQTLNRIRYNQEKKASFISQITALCNAVPPLLWLMCRNNSQRGGTDRHEIHATARYRHCSPRPHCHASVSAPLRKG